MSTPARDGNAVPGGNKRGRGSKDQREAKIFGHVDQAALIALIKGGCFVQIAHRLPDAAAARLRKAGLIEGRKPNLFVSASVAKATASLEDYLRTRGQDDAFYLKLITDYLAMKGEASRADINKLLLDKLSEALSEKQKAIKVSSLLTKLRRKETIVNVGSDTASCWKLVEK